MLGFSPGREFLKQRKEKESLGGRTYNQLKTKGNDDE